MFRIIASMTLSSIASAFMTLTICYPFFVHDFADVSRTPILITIAHIAAIIVDITMAVFCCRIVGCFCCGNRSEPEILVMDNLTVQQGKVKGQWV